MQVDISCEKVGDIINALYRFSWSSGKDVDMWYPGDKFLTDNKDYLFPPVALIYFMIGTRRQGDNES